MMSSFPMIWVLILVWIGSAAFWAWIAGRLGRSLNVPNDGCLLGCGNVVLSFAGGGIGFFLGPHPWSIYASLAGALLLPGLVTGFFISKNRPSS